VKRRETGFVDRGGDIDARYHLLKSVFLLLQQYVAEAPNVERICWGEETSLPYWQAAQK
jgi:hypothetical protein